MRGKPGRATCTGYKPRLIPAHAGKTNAYRFRVFQKRGSSPRMRGKRTEKNRKFLELGLIPAHAGKTRVSKWTYNPQRAHPRACGENSRQVRASR